MAKMKMRTKILLGFASALVLLAVAGVVSVTYLQQASNGFTHYRNWARDSSLVAELNESLLMARMNVKDCIIRATEQERQEFQDYYDEMREFLDDAQGEIANPERASMVDQIDEESVDYQTNFEQVVAYQKVREEHFAVLNSVISRSTRRKRGLASTSRFRR